MNKKWNLFMSILWIFAGLVTTIGFWTTTPKLFIACYWILMFGLQTEMYFHNKTRKILDNMFKLSEEMIERLKQTNKLLNSNKKVRN